MIFVCLEHLEDAIDWFTQEVQQPPDIFLLEQVQIDPLEIPQTCHFCQLQPTIVVKRYAD